MATSSGFSMECEICLEEIRDGRTLKCGHTFCVPCLRIKIVKKEILCPNCDVVTPVPWGGVKKLSKDVKMEKYTGVQKKGPNGELNSDVDGTTKQEETLKHTPEDVGSGSPIDCTDNAVSLSHSPTISEKYVYDGNGHFDRSEGEVTDLNLSGWQNEDTSLRNAQNKYIDLETKVTSLDNDLRDVVNSKVAGLEEDFNRKVACLKDDFNSKVTQFVNDRKVHFDRLEGEVTDFRGKLSGLQNEVTDFRGKLSCLQNEVTSLCNSQKKYKDLETKLTALDNDLMDAVNSKVAGLEKDFNRKVACLKGDFTHLESSINALKKDNIPARMKGAIEGFLKYISHSKSLKALVILVVLCAAAFSYQLADSIEPAEKSYDSEIVATESNSKRIQLKLLSDELKLLENKFPAQQPILWHTIRVVISRIIRDDVPIQPAVVLFGSSDTAKTEADCLARHLSQLVKDVFQSNEPISINVSKDYAGLTPEKAKLSLDDTLKNGFKSGSSCAVVNGLENMHGDTAILLHAFCDNTNAPLTKVAYFLTLHVAEYQMTGSKRDERKVEDYLTQVWGKALNIDDVNALLTRVANNIVIVKSESTMVINKHC